MAIDVRNPGDRKEFHDMAVVVGLTPMTPAAAQADFAGADVAALKVELNTFLGKLEAAGLVATS